MMNRKGSSFVIAAVAVLCCVFGARAEEVVAATEASATAPVAYVTPEYRDAAVAPAVAPAATEEAEFAAPVVAMEVAATAAAEDDGMLTLSMMEVGAHSETFNFNELEEEGTLQLTAEEQDAIVDSALDVLEVEFIRDYGSESDVEQLNAALAEDAEADQAAELGSPRFAQTEVGAAAEIRRRRRGGRGGGGGGRGRKFAGAPGGGAADIAAQCARAGFTAGNTSPAGLAEQAGKKNSHKMGGGFFKKLGRGIKKFARKAGRWLKDRFGGGHKGGPQGGPPGPMQQQQQQNAGPGGMPPAPGPKPAGGKGWFGRMFDKVKAFGGKVGNKIGALSQKAGNFLNKIGAKKWGANIKALGSKVKAWLNGKAVPPGTKGAVILPATSPQPMPGTPGGKGGPKISPGMPGTYQDAQGRWRGPSGKKVYTLEQQAIRKAEKAAAKAARKEAKAARRAARKARKAKRDAARKAEYAAWASKDAAAHREWQEAKAHQKRMDALKLKKQRVDYTGVEADRPDRKERLHTAEEVEDCVTCRYVWLQVEMDIGDTTLEDNVYDSFTQNALEAQKAPIFYPGCQMMWDQIDDMMGDYMDGKTVNQICENSLMCRLANP